MKRISVIVSTLCVAASAFAGPAGESIAIPYEKQSSNGQNEKSVVNAFSQSQTILQFCTIGLTLTCNSSQSLGVRYTSSSAYNELNGAYRCTYVNSTRSKTTSPGYDLYQCGSSSTLPGFTIMVLVEGDSSSSYAGTITALYQP